MPDCPPGIHYNLTDCGYQPACQPFHCNQISSHKSLNRANAITSQYIHTYTHILTHMFIYVCVGSPPGREVVKLAPVCYALLLSVFSCGCCCCCCCYYLHQFTTSAVGHLMAFKFIAFGVCAQYTHEHTYTHTCKRISHSTVEPLYVNVGVYCLQKPKTIQKIMRNSPQPPHSGYSVRA